MYDGILLDHPADDGIANPDRRHARKSFAAGGRSAEHTWFVDPWILIPPDNARCYPKRWLSEHMDANPGRDLRSQDVSDLSVGS